MPAPDHHGLGLHRPEVTRLGQVAIRSLANYEALLSIDFDPTSITSKYQLCPTPPGNGFVGHNCLLVGHAKQAAGKTMRVLLLLTFLQNTVRHHETAPQKQSSKT